MRRRASPKDRDAGEALWRFSLALYARPGVAAALLTLQDRGGHDVNLMLYALWLGVCRRRRIDAAGLAAAAAATQTLNAEAVAPLRQLRRRLKDSPDVDLAMLRRRVLRLELEAERMVQYGLAALVDAAPAADGDAFAAATANLAQYLGEEAGSSEAKVLIAALAELTRRS